MFLLIMLYYMYERKSNTLQDLRVQYQLPYGMVSEIPEEDIKTRNRRISSGTGAADC